MKVEETCVGLMLSCVFIEWSGLAGAGGDGTLHLGTIQISVTPSLCSTAP